MGASLHNQWSKVCPFFDFTGPVISAISENMNQDVDVCSIYPDSSGSSCVSGWCWGSGRRTEPSCSSWSSPPSRQTSSASGDLQRHTESDTAHRAEGHDVNCTSIWRNTSWYSAFSATAGINRSKVVALKHEIKLKPYILELHELT